MSKRQRGIVFTFGIGAVVLAWLAGCVASPRAAEGPWSRGAAMPTARSEIAATVLDGRIYVAGGIGRLGTTGAFEVYEPATDGWRALAPLPVPLHHLAMAAAGGRIYVTGGYDDIFFTPDR